MGRLSPVKGLGGGGGGGGGGADAEVDEASLDPNAPSPAAVLAASGRALRSSWDEDEGTKEVMTALTGLAGVMAKHKRPSNANVGMLSPSSRAGRAGTDEEPRERVSGEHDAHMSPGWGGGGGGGGGGGSGGGGGVRTVRFPAQHHACGVGAPSPHRRASAMA